MMYTEKVWKALEETLKETYGMDMEQVLTKDRHKSTVQVRFILIHLLHSYTGETFDKMAERFRRDRSTIYHAMDTAESFLKYDKPFQYDYKLFKQKLGEKLK